LLHSGADTCVEDSTVERKRIAVFVVSGGRLGGVESDIFPKRFDAVVAVLARVLYAALISAQESRRLILFLGEPRFARDEADVGPTGIDIF